MDAYDFGNTSYVHRCPDCGASNWSMSFLSWQLATCRMEVEGYLAPGAIAEGQSLRSPRPPRKLTLPKHHNPFWRTFPCLIGKANAKLPWSLHTYDLTACPTSRSTRSKSPMTSAQTACTTTLWKPFSARVALKSLSSTSISLNRPHSC